MLIKKADLKGFEGNEGKLLLERLVRATLITTIRNPGDRLKERVASIKPYSLVSMKTAETQSLRRVDVFMYQALKSVPPDVKVEKKGSLKEHLIRIFGTGVRITERPDLDGKYDGHTDLDTLTRLSILFLDGFGSAPSNVKRDKEDLLGACPALAQKIGHDTLSTTVTLSRQTGFSSVLTSHICFLEIWLEEPIHQRFHTQMSL